MFALSHQQRFNLFSQAVDMRKGFGRLSGSVQPGAGHSSRAGMYLTLSTKLGGKSLLVYPYEGFLVRFIL
jgi:hypothetical protein